MNSVRVITADDGFSHICCREDVSKLTLYLQFNYKLFY